MTTQLQKKSENFGVMLNKHRKSIIAALPRHIDPNQWMRVALTAYTKNPDLQECTPISVFLCAVEAAQLGLTLDGALGHAYIVKYKREAQFICGYRGYIELAYRSGKIAKISAQVVRDGDKFEYKYGLTPVLAHIPGMGEGRKLTHAYAIAHFSDVHRTVEFKVMDREEILKHRDASPSASSSYSPWKKWETEMWQKTVIRSLVKMLPLTPEIQKVVGLDGQAEAGLTQSLNIPDYIEAEATEAFFSTDARMDTLKEKMREEKTQVPNIEEEPPEKQRKSRKGLCSGTGITELNKLALAADLTSEEFTNILGIHGATSIMEVKAGDQYQAIIKDLKGMAKQPSLLEES